MARCIKHNFKNEHRLTSHGHFKIDTQRKWRAQWPAAYRSNFLTFMVQRRQRAQWPAASKVLFAFLHGPNKAAGPMARCTIV